MDDFYQRFTSSRRQMDVNSTPKWRQVKSRNMYKIPLRLAFSLLFFLKPHEFFHRIWIWNRKHAHAHTNTHTHTHTHTNTHTRWSNYYDRQADLAIYLMNYMNILTYCLKLQTPSTSTNKAYGTRCSQAVPHPSTILARRCLTSVIRRERVCSSWYGRRQHFHEF